MCEVDYSRTLAGGLARLLCGAALILTLLCPFLVLGAQDSPAKDKLVVETLIRLKRFDLSSNEKWKSSVVRHLQTIEGTRKFVQQVELFRLKEFVPALLQISIEQPRENLGVDAARALLNMGETELFISTINGKNDTAALAILEVLSQTGRPEVNSILMPVVEQNKHSRQLRNMAAIGLTKTIQGQHLLLQLVIDNQLNPDLNFAVGNALYASGDPSIQKKARELITLPAVQGKDPLPPVAELLTHQGNSEKGRSVFESKGNCAKCHKVRGAGKEVGPDLSEIGSKLSREAIFVSILDPSAGVSHNYETYSILTVSGNVLSGIMVSDTKESIVIRNADGIDRTLAVEEIDEIRKTGLSLMPADLQKTMNVQELVHVVEYLTTLRKPR